MKVSKGLATWAGLVAALGQYLAAVAVFLAAPDPNVALGPLATATATLYTVIKGRMDQATAHIQNPKPTPAPLSFSTGQSGGFSSATATHLGNVVSGQIVGRGVAGSAFTPGESDEPGDPDALPDYKTETDPPPDEGDTSANGDTGEREG